MTSDVMMKYQYQEIISQLSLLELHDVAIGCPCTLSGGGDIHEWCIPKHLLTIGALCGESSNMANTKSERDMLLDIQAEAMDYHEQAKKGIVCKKGNFPEGIAEWARKSRKSLEPLYYACSIKPAVKVHLHSNTHPAESIAHFSNYKYLDVTISSPDRQHMLTIKMLADTGAELIYIPQLIAAKLHLPDFGWQETMIGSGEKIRVPISLAIITLANKERFLPIGILGNQPLFGILAMEIFFESEVGR
ncbi:MAG: hypothetical protein Q8R31_05880 [Candidatus Omnitrophota bacterium]|nr:hypothetical protein [Candidatus Omnitrophota bacterium]